MVRVNERHQRNLRLHGFNNLTKTLSLNIYDISYAHTPAQRQAYRAYIDEVFNAKRLGEILTNVSQIIGANILNIAQQDYEPEGASVTILISEEPVSTEQQLSTSATPGPLTSSMAVHLDKSHITVHTYPESHPERGISTFRADIEVSTCGRISPLKALNYLIHNFESDIITLDYRVRGFTRDIKGKKHFIDHKINSIQNFMSKETKKHYSMIDVNIYQENTFHTKMIVRDLAIEDYLYGNSIDEFSTKHLFDIKQMINKEMQEIFYGRNMNAI